MKTIRLLIALLLGTQAAMAQSLQRVAPEQVGMSSRHLMYADQAIQ